MTRIKNNTLKRGGIKRWIKKKKYVFFFRLVLLSDKCLFMPLNSLQSPLLENISGEDFVLTWRGGGQRSKSCHVLKDRVKLGPNRSTPDMGKKKTSGIIRSKL